MTKRLRIVLIASLVLNLFVVGGLVGGAIMWQRAQVTRPMAALGRPAIRQAAAALSPEYRKQFRDAFRATAQSLRPQAVAARKARQDVAALLALPGYDGAALDAAIRRSREADMQVRTALEARTMAFMKSLPAEERIAFGKELIRVAERQRERRLAARRARQGETQ